MNRLLTLSAAGLALSVPLSAEPVGDFIQAWQKGDAAALTKALGGAEYTDGDWNRAIDAEDWAAYVASFRGKTLKLLSQTQVEGGVRLSWSLGSSGADYTDTLTLRDGRVTEVVTKGVAATAAEAAWAAGFEAARRDGLNPALRDAFTPGALVFGRNFPPAGATVNQYLSVLASIPGSVYRRLPESAVNRAKDGHLYWDFDLKYASGSTLVAGRDHVYREGDLVSRFVGVY